MSHNYVCEMCRGEFSTRDEWTDEMALAEAQEKGHIAAPEEMAVVCHDCYQKLEARFAPSGRWPATP